jgi:basic amino acid/polyamine antiporter, APA family
MSLILYGVGDILGSGIYGLIGKVAGQMGNLIWLAFAVGFVIALLTGLSYAGLGARYPRAAGSSFIVWKSFRSPLIAFVVGLATLSSGLTSMAATSRIFSGYLNGMIAAIPVWVGILIFAGILTTIVYVGIRESIWANAVCTVIELCGLLIVIVAGLPFLGQVNLLDTASIPQSGSLNSTLLLSSAVLAFYSFIGFEDLLNVSEEVKDPKKNLPIGLMVAVLISSLVYMLIGVFAVSVIPAAELAASNQPLVDVVAKAWPWFPSKLFSVIAMFAVANTALLNYIMVTRLMYGLANLSLLPKPLAKIHSRTKTPYIAVAITCAVLLILAFVGEVSSLARATALFVLMVFIAMNISLFVLQRREAHHKGKRRWRIPQFVPVLGAIGSAVMFVHGKAEDYKIAGVMLAVILVLYAIKRPTAAQMEKFEESTQT